MATRGIDVRQTSTRIVFRAVIYDSSGVLVTTGTTEIRIFRLEDDGTIDVYDWTADSFVATGSGTPDDEDTMSAQNYRDSTGADLASGVWTKVLTNVGQFTKGQVYIVRVTNTGGSPASQFREFQFGATEGGQVEVTTEGNSLDVSSTGEAGLDFDNVKNATGATTLTNITIPNVTTTTSVTDLAAYTAARAGYLDNLNISDNVASETAVASIQNNTRASIQVPDPAEIQSSDIDYKIRIHLYDTAGNMEAPDSAPTISAENQAGTSRNANLSATTMTFVETGVYEVDYTVATSHAQEQILISISVVEGGVTRKLSRSFTVVDSDAIGFSTSDRTILTNVEARIGSSITGTGSNTLLGFIQSIVRSDVSAPSDLGGSFDPSTDSLEAADADRGAIETDTQDIQSRLPSSLVSGRIDASVGSMANDVMTAAALAADFTGEIWDHVEADLGSAPNTNTATIGQLMQFVAMVAINQVTSTSALASVRNNAGTVIASAAQSDDGTTFTRNQY